jgi:protease-4
MKQFLKYTLASITGTFLTFLLFFLILIAFIGGAISSAFSGLDKSNQVTRVKDNTVLHVKLDKLIVDRGPDEHISIDFGPFQSQSALGLNQILENIEKAKNDEKITGIFLDLSFVQAGFGTVEEIRNALIDFKESGKWIISYSEIYSQKAYYLASVSDEIYVYPEGIVDFRGLRTTLAFLKGTMDKLDIEPQIIRGSNNKFKSAVEPFIMEEMSQANRMQTEAWLGSMWDHMVQKISESRNMSPEELKRIADNYEVQTAEDAVALGMASATKYYDEVIDILKFKTETDEEDDINSVTMTKYLRAPDASSGKSVPFYKKDAVAVVYASGSIMSGEGDDETIGSDKFAKAIRSARRDTSIKAIVLRVNSPGGSALASDVIWREVSLAKKEKPVVVSMGDVAASGGYYISAAADEIFAMPTTVTGSIGVFGIIPNMKGFFNDKLGMTFDGVKTGEFADFGEITRPLTDAEYDILQTSVDRTYDEFLTIVSDGRNIEKEKVDEIGQGRVWSGANAIDLKLVDKFGGLNAAIERAAELAELEDYRVKDLPKRKDPFQQLMEDLTGQAYQNVLVDYVGVDKQLLRRMNEAKSVQEMKGIQALMPYSIIIE